MQDYVFSLALAYARASETRVNSIVKSSRKLRTSARWICMMPRQKMTFAVKRTKSGLGLFAIEPIPKGKRIIEYTGPLVPNEDVEKSYGKYFFGVNKKWSINGSVRSNIARYINHSCSPNAEAFISGRRVWIWSRKRIKPGEEIAYDYGKEYFDDIIKPMGCKCEKCGSKPKRSKKKS